MKILAIDPGTNSSGFAIMSQRMFLGGQSDIENGELLNLIPDLDVDLVACEWVQSYGMAVGKDVFETCRWIGRIEQVVENERLEFRRVFRSDVKLHLCHSRKAKDPNVRQAILDSYPATGGGSTPQVGTKGQPGPLYGVKGHIWSALALALTVQEAESLTEVA